MCGGVNLSKLFWLPGPMGKEVELTLFQKRFDVQESIKESQTLFLLKNKWQKSFCYSNCCFESIHRSDAEALCKQHTIIAFPWDKQG